MRRIFSFLKHEQRKIIEECLFITNAFLFHIDGINW